MNLSDCVFIPSEEDEDYLDSFFTKVKDDPTMRQGIELISDSELDEALCPMESNE